MIDKLLFAYWRHYKHEIHPREMAQVLKRGPFPTTRKYAMALSYADGWTLEEIANIHNVTRERVRQCLWLVWHERLKSG